MIGVKVASFSSCEHINSAHEFFTLNKLWEEQLMKQVHNVFDLGDMSSVLQTLGQAKRDNPSDSECKRKIFIHVVGDMKAFI